jgi:methylglutaconyl-CoA hydratase
MAVLLIDKVDEHIIKLTLNRPDKRNALNIELLQALQEQLMQIKDNPSIRVVILKGAGPCFCAGLDLQEATHHEAIERSSTLLSAVFYALYTCRCITIAAVHGAVIAGGGGLMCACDYALAAAGTQFAFPEVKRGLVPAFVSTLLHRQLHPKAIRELLLFGDSVSCERALALGLINRIESADALDEATLRLAKQGNEVSCAAVQATKKLLQDLEPRALEDDLALSMSVHRHARMSKAAAEKIER